MGYFIFRLKGIADGLAAGAFPVKIQTSQIDGYGYPVGVMFCDILYYPAAALNLLGLSIENCYRLIILAINLLTVAIGLYSYSRLLGSRRYGLIATALYTLSYYRLENITLRADVGEALGMAFLPLLTLSLASILNDKKDLFGNHLNKEIAPDWLLYGLSFSGVICSNIPLTVIAILFQVVSVLCVLLFRPSSRSVMTLGKLLKGALITFLLTAFYTVPFLDYYLNANLAVTAGLLGSGTQVGAATHSVNPSQLFAVFQQMSGWSNQYQYLSMPTTIGSALILMPLVSALFYKKGTATFAKKIFLALACVSLFAASSLFPWSADIPIVGRAIKVLANIQFPWRFLSYATLFLTVYSALSLSYIGERTPCVALALTGIILVASLFEASFGIASFVKNGQTTNAATILSENDGIYDAQFIPASTYHQRPDFSINKPVAITNGITVDSFIKTGCNLELEIDVGSTGEIALPMLSYPYYVVNSSNEGIEARIRSNSNGQIVLYVIGSGKARITVNFNEPPLWRIGEFCSVVTLSGIIIYAIGIKNSMPHAKQHEP